MMMSVFRQDRAPIALDHLACLRLGTTSQDVEMISWAVLNGKPALVGLDDQPSIVKLQEAGDDAMSYADLYDVALTLREFTRMKAHGVSELEAIGDVLYRITLIAEISDDPRVTVLVKAKDETAVQLRLKELLATPEFSTQLSIAPQSKPGHLARGLPYGPGGSWRGSNRESGMRRDGDAGVIEATNCDCRKQSADHDASARPRPLTVREDRGSGSNGMIRSF